MLNDIRYKNLYSIEKVTQFRYLLSLRLGSLFTLVPLMDSPPLVSVVIVHYNNIEDTIECLESVAASDYQPIKVFLVNNSSEYLKKKELKFEFELRILDNGINDGFTGGYNNGIRAALESKSTYILCLNNDAILEATTIQHLVDVGNCDDEIGALCPKEYRYYEPRVLNYAGGKLGLTRRRARGVGEIDRGQYDVIKDTEMLCGPAMFFKSSAIEDVGLFDDMYFFSHEDSDIALRLRKSGYRIIFVPHSIIWHKRAGSTDGGFGNIRSYFHARNLLIYLRKHKSTYNTLAVYVYYFIFHLPLLIVRLGIYHRSPQAVKYALMGVLWHVKPELFPDDADFVERISD